MEFFLLVLEGEVMMME